MAKQKKKKTPPLEDGLLKAMSALDRQIAREMQRSPAERSNHGLQKWDPLNSRIETVSAFILEKIGDHQLQLDSLLVCSQAMVKSLMLITHDLGSDGLGKLRTAYTIQALENVAEDARRGLEYVQPSHGLN